METHDAAEVDVALKVGASIIGINHRDLDDLTMNMSLSADLAPRFQNLFLIQNEILAEHGDFDGRTHVPLMTLPGMRERTVRIGSAGKTFSLTGWKVGYITAAPALLTPIAKAHQFVTFTTAPNLQQAVAMGLAKPDDYFSGLAAEMQAKRDRFAAGLSRVGFEVIACEGTYFITGDFRPLGFEGNDVDFCRHITVEAGVTAVPVSAFYISGEVDHFVRFCFCKQDALLDAAIERLAALFGRSG